MARGDEKEIGEPVDVFQRRRAHPLALLTRQRHHQALGTPGNGAGEVQMGGGRAAGRENEGL